MSDAARWAVVATVDEPPALVQAYVAWHLQIGAAEVFLYFDRPDDPAANLFAHLDAVHVVRCDRAQWKAVGGHRPHRHEVRQLRNARNAYARTGADWLLHSDADEFLWPVVPMSDVLAATPAAADCVVVPVAERMYRQHDAQGTIFGGVFRLPFEGKVAAGRKVFGPQYDLTNRGLTGHAQGKALSRVGRDLRLSIHRPKVVKGQPLLVHKPGPSQMALLHFEGLTPAQWVFKLSRLAQSLTHDDGMPPSPHRARQLAFLAEDPDAAAALHDLLKVLDAGGEARLKAHDLLLVPDFDPRPALAACFPGQDIDLSTDGVDHWLAENKAAILRFFAK